MRRFIETVLVVILLLAFAGLVWMMISMAGCCPVLAGDRPEAHVYQAFRSNECFVCGSTQNVELAHALPYSLCTGTLERLRVEPTNCISLCHEDHFRIAHYGNWKKWNARLIPICQELRDARKEP